MGDGVSHLTVPTGRWGDGVRDGVSQVTDPIVPIVLVVDFEGVKLERNLIFQKTVLTGCNHGGIGELSPRGLDGCIDQCVGGILWIKRAVDQNFDAFNNERLIGFHPQVLKADHALLGVVFHTVQNDSGLRIDQIFQVECQSVCRSSGAFPVKDGSIFCDTNGRKPTAGLSLADDNGVRSSC